MLALWLSDQRVDRMNEFGSMEVKENFSGDPPDPASFGAGLSEVDRHVQQFNLTGLLPPTVRFSTFLESSLRINKSKIIGS